MVSNRPPRAVRDRQAIHELKYRYCWAIDGQHVERFVDCFDDDATLSARKFGASEPHLELAGRDELRELVRTRKATFDRRLDQHRPYNPIVEFDGDDAVGRWYFTAVSMAADGDVTVEFGEYHDEYRRMPDGWKITSSTVVYLEIQPEVTEIEPADSG